jgi:hypothetical protein
MLRTWTLAIILLARWIVKSLRWPISHTFSQSWRTTLLLPTPNCMRVSTPWPPRMLLGALAAVAVLYEGLNSCVISSRDSPSELYLNRSIPVSPESWWCFVELFNSSSSPKIFCLWFLELISFYHERSFFLVSFCVCVFPLKFFSPV